MRARISVRPLTYLEGLEKDFTGELQYQRLGRPVYPSVLVRTFLGASLTLIGDFKRAESVFTDGLKIANEVKHPYSQTIIGEEFSYCLYWLGRKGEALNHLEEYLDICVEYDVYTMHCGIVGRLAIVLAEDGQIDRAIELAEDALVRETFRRAGQIGYHFLLYGLATAYLTANRLDDALDKARLSEQLSLGSNEYGCNAFAHALIGDIKLARNALKDAEDEILHRYQACAELWDEAARSPVQNGARKRLQKFVSGIRCEKAAANGSANI